MENHDLLEFDKLKDEQIGRLAYRDNLFYLTMGVIGSIVAAYFTYSQAKIVLLWLPCAMFIVGVAHLTCERRIQDIGLYVRTRLAPLIALRNKEPETEVFAWETFFRNSKWHSWRKLLHLISNIMLYVLSGAVAIAAYWSARNNAENISSLELVMTAIDILMVASMLALIIIFERFSPDDTIASANTAPSRRWSLLKALLVSVVVTTCSSALTFYGYRTFGLPPSVLNVLVVAHVPVPGATATTLIMAFIAWTASLLVTRR